MSPRATARRKDWEIFADFSPLGKFIGVGRHSRFLYVNYKTKVLINNENWMTIARLELESSVIRAEIGWSSSRNFPFLPSAGGTKVHN